MNNGQHDPLMHYRVYVVEVIRTDGAGNQFAIDSNNPDIPIEIEFEYASKRFNPFDGMELKRETLSGWFTSVIKKMVDDGYHIKTGKMQGGIWSSALIVTGGIVLIFSFVIGAYMLFN